MSVARNDISRDFQVTRSIGALWLVPEIVRNRTRSHRTLIDRGTCGRQRFRKMNSAWRPVELRERPFCCGYRCEEPNKHANGRWFYSCKLCKNFVCWLYEWQMGSPTPSMAAKAAPHTPPSRRLSRIQEGTPSTTSAPFTPPKQSQARADLMRPPTTLLKRRLNFDDSPGSGEMQTPAQRRRADGVQSVEGIWREAGPAWAQPLSQSPVDNQTTSGEPFGHTGDVRSFSPVVPKSKVELTVVSDNNGRVTEILASTRPFNQELKDIIKSVRNDFRRPYWHLQVSDLVELANAVSRTRNFGLKFVGNGEQVLRRAFPRTHSQSVTPDRNVTHSPAIRQPNFNLGQEGDCVPDAVLEYVQAQSTSQERNSFGHNNNEGFGQGGDYGVPSTMVVNENRGGVGTDLAPAGPSPSGRSDFDPDSLYHIPSIRCDGNCPFLDVQIISKTFCSLKACPYSQELVDMCRSIPGHIYDSENRYWKVPLKELPWVLCCIQSSPFGIKMPPKWVLDAIFKPRHSLTPSTDDVFDIIGTLPADVFFLKLFSYQKEGVEFGIRHKGRMLLADEMGLGKTLQAIFVAACFPDAWPLLVICPSAVRPHWREQFKTWLPDDLHPKPEDVWVLNSSNDIGEKMFHFPNGPLTSRHICIISYDLVWKSFGVYLRHYKGIICDECHRLKNPTTQRTKSIAPFVKRAKLAIMMTGTPLLSKPIELYTQVDMLHPGLLGSYWDFGDRYCVKAGAPYLSQTFRQYRDSEHLEELKLILEGGVMIRRLKKDVGSDLPSKWRQRCFVDVTEDTQVQLQNLQNEIRTVQRDPSLREEAKVTRLKQITTQMYNVLGPGKVGASVEIIREYLAAGQKLLVFAHHRDVLDGLQAPLSEHSMVRIDGSTSPAGRQEAARKFQEDADVRLALLSITAAGVGLTLTRADAVIFAELYWTPSDLIQAEDRAHRVGQTADVLPIVYLCASGTLDDKLWEQLIEKSAVVGSVMDGEEKETFGAFRTGRRLFMD